MIILALHSLYLISKSQEVTPFINRSILTGVLRLRDYVNRNISFSLFLRNISIEFNSLDLKRCAIEVNNYR